MLKRLAHILFFLFLIVQLTAQQRLNVDVLVVGGGASGISAGIQSARLGVSTIIAEETSWLGGMITAAGVSAFDGNHNMPSGIWSEFRDQLYKVYGGAGKVATGWVSNTLFEPHVGDSIFRSMAERESLLRVRTGLSFRKCLLKNNQVIGAEFYEPATKNNILIYAKQVIDATELGDVLASAKIPYDLGLDAIDSTAKKLEGQSSALMIQDLTYVAILKNYGKEADRTIPKPADYDPMEFDGCCNEFCSKPEKLTSNVTAQKMLDYGKLPNGKYMINWPGKGNDIYLNIIELDPIQRAALLEKAKAKTLRFLYFLQTQFGFRNLDLADDEYPSSDRLPLIPYYRESRRVQGLVRFSATHISSPFEFELYRTGIAVGDYPIDHHHREYGRPSKHPGFPSIPSFNIPMGALIPATHNGIVIAEKNISVSHMVNGTTRLQPVVMLIGQASGTLAALAVKNKQQAREVPVRLVQKTLLETGAYIMPYYDVNPRHPHFKAIQRIGATGLLKGKGQSFQWANRTWFYPDSTVNGQDFAQSLIPFGITNTKTSETLTIAEAIDIIQAWAAKEKKNIAVSEQTWSEWGLTKMERQRPITRAELAVLLDKTMRPFDRPVDIQGKLK
mgnify:CR=1 FL=1